MTILMCPIAKMASTHPTHWAVSGEYDLTYADCHQLVSRWVAGLSRFPAGAVVAIRLLRPLDIMAVMMACFRLGLVAYPISDRLTFQEQFTQLSRSGASVLVTDGIIPPELSIPVMDPKLLSNQVSSHADHALDQAALLLATSGTTATSRLAMLGYSNLYYSALGVVHRFSMGPESRILLCLPLYHVAGVGVMMRTFLAGATMVIHSKTTTLTDQLQDNISHVSLVPTQLHRVSPTVSLPMMQSILVGGARLEPLLVSQRDSWPIHQSYGCTEMGSTIAIVTKTGLEPLPHREVRVMESGDIQVRGDTLFWGYWVEGLLHLPLTVDGWFVTQDTLHHTHDGAAIFRHTDWINSGGEKLLLDDIESQFKTVCEACLVTGIPDEDYGQRPVMMVKNPQQPGFNLVMNGLNSIMRPMVVPWNHHIDGGDKQARIALREWVIQLKKDARNSNLDVGISS